MLPIQYIKMKEDTSSASNLSLLRNCMTYIKFHCKSQWGHEWWVAKLEILGKYVSPDWFVINTRYHQTLNDKGNWLPPALQEIYPASQSLLTLQHKDSHFVIWDYSLWICNIKWLLLDHHNLSPHLQHTQLLNAQNKKMLTSIILASKF